jgi:dolichol-phosphate mannosyltransferase
MNIQPTVSVILPTYNEYENIGLIIPKIFKELADENITSEIIVVDDNSPDGTAGFARDLGNGYNVKVYVRKEEKGLATAVMKGFELSKGEICLVMDADMSHPTEKIPEMIRPILAGDCDATVGSRYVAGGGLKDWPFARRLISKGAGLLASGLVKISDTTSGFMAIRRKLLEGKHFDPVGWKIVLEVLVKTNCKVNEVPIVFKDREKGTSKLNLKVQRDYLLHLWKLYCYRYPKLFEFIKFCLVGTFGLVIDTCVLIFLVELGKLDPRFAAIFAFSAAASCNYFLNRFWTFTLVKKMRIVTNYIAFVVICLMGLGVRIGVMHLLIQYGKMGRGLWYILASIAGIICGTIFNFMGSKRMVFSETFLWNKK